MTDHKGHILRGELSDEQLDNPSTFLTPLESNKSNAVSLQLNLLFKKKKLKADQLHPRFCPHMPPDYRLTGKHPIVSGIDADIQYLEGGSTECHRKPIIAI